MRIIHFTKTFFSAIFFDIILLADKRPTFIDRFRYWYEVIITSAPVAYLLMHLGLWFTDNQRFAVFVTVAILVNMVIGIVYHFKFKSFNWELFLKRNSVMILVVIVTYVLLEQLRLTAGDNFAGDVFKILIQISTLLYPTSKALKNIYILSNKQHPPAWIMEKLYRFEKSGNMKDLFDSDKPKDDDNQMQTPA